MHTEEAADDYIAVFEELARDSRSGISVTVSPGAARTELVGRHGDGWKARVAAPPERGRANDALVALVASLLEVPADSVRVVGGQRGRAKVVEVDALDLGEVERRLEEARKLVIVTRLARNRPLALTLALTGCGSSSSDNQAAPATSTSTSPPSMATTSDCQPLAGVSTAPQKSSANEKS